MGGPFVSQASVCGSALWRVRNDELALDQVVRYGVLSGLADLRDRLLTGAPEVLQNAAGQHSGTADPGAAMNGNSAARFEIAGQSRCQCRER